jgi:hypothetical protein
MHTLYIHRQQRELEVMQMAADAKVRTRSASKALPKTAAVLPAASPVHTASVLSASERQDAAAANAARMLRGVPFPARTYPSAAPQSPSTAQKKALAKDAGATSSSSAVKPAPATPVPHAAVSRPFDASGISSDNGTARATARNGTAQRLVTPTGTVVAAPYAEATMLSAAAVAGSTATTGVAQPTVVAQEQHQHQYQQQLQNQQEQQQQPTAANTVDLTLGELSDYTSGSEEFPLLTPASCYGVPQPRVPPVTSSSSSTNTNSAEVSGRHNSMVCSEDVVANIKALSLSAASRVRCSIQHMFRTMHEYVRCKQ